MRTLVRWSDSSLSTTTPRPEKAEPSRCMTRSLLQGLVGPGREIAGVDRLKTWLLHAEIFEAALHGDHLGRSLRPHIAIGVQAELADAGLFNAADAGNEREPFGKSCAVRLDIDHITPAQHFTAEFGHRAH